MSPWWLDDLRVVLAPGWARAGWVVGLRRGQRTPRCVERGGAAGDGRGAEGADTLAMLESALEAANAGATARVRILLAGALSKVMLVEMAAGLAREEERIAYVHHRFARILDSAAAAHDIVVHRQSRAAPWFGAAVERSFAEGIREVLTRRQMRLAGIEPLVAPLLRLAGRRISEGWLGAIEPGSFSLARLGSGSCLRLQTHRVFGPIDRQFEVLLRSAALAAGEDLASGPPGGFVAAFGVQIERLGLPHDWRFTPLPGVDALGASPVVIGIRDAATQVTA